jgi:DNA repair protein RadC
MKYKSIKDWPEDERPRERLLRSGAGDLSTAQLMAIILGTGGKNKSALGLSREILDRFKGLKEIDDASLAEFSDLKGMGSAKIAQIKSALELGRRLMMADKGRGMKKPRFKDSRQVYEYYMPRFFGLKKERFLCSLLDSKNRVFKETVISEGTLTSSLVHPREVFRYAIKEAAASVIFIHNHPSGDPSPSRDDIAITRRLMETGKIIDIRVIDHIIIGDGRYVSIIDEGFVREQTGSDVI